MNVIELHVHHELNARTAVGGVFRDSTGRGYDVELYDEEGREHAEARIAALREAGTKVEVVGGP